MIEFLSIWAGPTSWVLTALVLVISIYRLKKGGNQ